jgi:uncharacterized protein (TIGR02246 family)
VGGRAARAAGGLTMTVELPDDIAALFAEHDAAFAEGDAERFARVFSEDGRMLLVHSETLRGRAAIAAQFGRGFAKHDTSAWIAETELLDVIDGHACAIRSYTETLVPRDGGPRQAVVGRLVSILRREVDGRWRIAVQMNNHTRPIEELA